MKKNQPKNKLNALMDEITSAVDQVVTELVFKGKTGNKLLKMSVKNLFQKFPDLMRDPEVKHLFYRYGIVGEILQHKKRAERRKARAAKD